MRIGTVVSKLLSVQTMLQQVSLSPKGQTQMPGPSSQKKLVIANVTVIDATGKPPKSHMDVFIEGDLIAAVVPATRERPGQGITRVDGGGKFLIPGLWDVHAHSEASAATLALYVANGVTGIRDMGCDYGCLAKLQEWREKAAHGEHLLQPHLLMAGPNLEGRTPGPRFLGHLRVENAKEARAGVDALKRHGADFIKVRDWLSRESYFSAAARAKVDGLDVVGHLPTAVSATEGASVGQRSIEHLGSDLGGNLLACSRREKILRRDLLGKMADAQTHATAVNPYHYAQTAPFQRALVGDYDTRKAAHLFGYFRHLGVAQVPTLFVLHPNLQTAEPVINGVDFSRSEYLKYVPTAVVAEWRRNQKVPAFKPADIASQRARFAKQLDMVKAMHRAGVTLLSGTDAALLDETRWIVPGFSLHEELSLLVQAGLPPMAALQAATSRPAQFFNHSRLGTVEKGKIADLVLLDADPLADIRNTRQIRAVLLNGRHLSRQALDEALARVEKHARNGSDIVA